MDLYHLQRFRREALWQTDSSQQIRFSTVPFYPVRNSLAFGPLSLSKVVSGRQCGHHVGVLKEVHGLKGSCSCNQFVRELALVLLLSVDLGCMRQRKRVDAAMYTCW